MLHYLAKGKILMVLIALLLILSLCGNINSHEQVAQPVEQYQTVKPYISTKEVLWIPKELRVARLSMEVPLEVSSDDKVIEPQIQAISEWMDFRGSYYNSGVNSTGKQRGDKDHGITRSGRHVEDGVTLSVDPKIIPLNSWVEIQYPDGTLEVRRADDTGSAIKGYKVDIFKEASDKELRILGIVRVKLRIIRNPNEV